MPIHATDVSYPSYQEAYFYYLFGVIEMDCYGLLDFLNEKVVLFVPKMNNLLKIWMTVMTTADYETKYGYEVRYVDDLAEYMATNCSAA